MRTRLAGVPTVMISCWKSPRGWLRRSSEGSGAWAGELVAAVAETGKPLILVIMAGRPLTLGDVLDHVDAVLFSFHPGTMAGPALVDLLFGVSFERPVLADHAQVGVVGLGPRAGKEDVVQVPRREVCKFRGEVDGGDVAGLKEGVVIGQFAHLAGGDLGQFVAAIADVHAP